MINGLCSKAGLQPLETIAVDGPTRQFCNFVLTPWTASRFRTVKSAKVNDLREGFDSIAEVYDRVRPTYPSALFDELFSQLVPDPVILEIGPGTGQATGSLLRNRARVTAVELGPHLAALLKKNFGAENNLRVIVSSFEEVDLPKHHFDAIVSATAFHWIPKPLRIEKAAQLLAPHGWLAIIETVQVEAPTDKSFFARAQPIYERHGQATVDFQPPTPDMASGQFFEELCETTLFDNPTLSRYRWDQKYNTNAYIDLMRSYSGTQAMSELERNALLGEMSEFIDQEFEGSVTRPLVITLTMAQLSSSVRQVVSD